MATLISEQAAAAGPATEGAHEPIEASDVHVWLLRSAAWVRNGRSTSGCRARAARDGNRDSGAITVGVGGVIGNAMDSG